MTERISRRRTQKLITTPIIQTGFRIFRDGEEITSPSKIDKSPLKVYNKSTDDKPPEETANELLTLHARIRRTLMLEQKTKKEALFIAEHLGHLRFIREFNQQNTEVDEQEALIYLCKNFKYEKFEAGKVIFEEGDLSNGKIYIILTGEVLIVKKTVDYYTLKNIEAWQKQEEEKRKRRAEIAKKKRIGGFVEPEPIEEAKQAEEDEISMKQASIITASTKDVKGQIMSYGTMVDTIGEGGHFGEKAAVSDAPRGATIITSKPTELIVLSAEVYRTIQRKLQKTIVQKMNFLQKYFPCIERIQNKNTLENLIYVLEERTFQLHNSITTEGETGEYIYIILDGSCDIYKRDPDYVDPVEGSRVNTIPTFITKGRTFVCTINQGIFFGEEILYNTDGKYEFTVRAASSCVIVYGIEKGKFNLRFPSSTFMTLHILNDEKKKNYNRLGEANREEKKRQISHGLVTSNLKKHVRNYSDLRSTQKLNAIYKHNMSAEKQEDSDIANVKVQKLMLTKHEEEKQKIYKVLYRNKHLELDQITKVIEGQKKTLERLEEKMQRSPRRHDKSIEFDYPHAGEVRFSFGRGDTPKQVRIREKIENRRLENLNKPELTFDNLDGSLNKRRSEYFMIEDTVGETTDRTFLNLIDKASKVVFNAATEHSPRKTPRIVVDGEESKTNRLNNSPFEKLFITNKRLTLDDLNEVYNKMERESVVQKDAKQKNKVPGELIINKSTKVNHKRIRTLHGSITARESLQNIELGPFTESTKSNKEIGIFNGPRIQVFKPKLPTKLGGGGDYSPRRINLKPITTERDFFEDEIVEGIQLKI